MTPDAKQQKLKYLEEQINTLTKVVSDLEDKIKELKDKIDKYNSATDELENRCKEIAKKGYHSIVNAKSAFVDKGGFVDDYNNTLGFGKFESIPQLAEGICENITALKDKLKLQIEDFEKEMEDLKEELNHNSSLLKTYKHQYNNLR